MIAKEATGGRLEQFLLVSPDSLQILAFADDTRRTSRFRGRHGARRGAHNCFGDQSRCLPGRMDSKIEQNCSTSENPTLEWWLLREWRTKVVIRQTVNTDLRHEKSAYCETQPDCSTINSKFAPVLVAIPVRCYDSILPNANPAFPSVCLAVGATSREQPA